MAKIIKALDQDTGEMVDGVVVKVVEMNDHSLILSLKTKQKSPSESRSLKW